MGVGAYLEKPFVELRIILHMNHRLIHWGVGAYAEMVAYLVYVCV